MRCKATIQYDGTNFLGWQLQPQGPTVQGALEDAASRLFGVPTRMRAAGRTDAGVHAAGQVISFDVVKPMAPRDIERAMNALTPEDLSITDVQEVDADFDPRRAATSRAYCYRIWTARWPSPFWRRYSWHVWGPLDIEAMAAAAAVLMGEHDFTSFRAVDCDAKHPVRRIVRSEIRREEAQLVYTVEATAFLRHMVRNITGTLVEVGRGARSVDEFRELLAVKDRQRAGATAPARGLCLMSVQYAGAAPAAQIEAD